MINVSRNPKQYYVSDAVLTSAAVMYIYNKGSIAGPTFKIPFMGPFLQSIDPKFDGYEAQWAQGKLSCLSVFHKYALHDY